MHAGMSTSPVCSTTGFLNRPRRPSAGAATASVSSTPGTTNTVLGDPESGKTLLTDHATVEQLADDGRVLRVDLDHNGSQSTLSRLIDFGGDEDALRDPDRFRYVEPADRLQLAAIVADAPSWRPTLVVLDSIGELLPLYGAGSNNADEFTAVHRQVIKPLAALGACVVGIDHLGARQVKRHRFRRHDAVFIVAKCQPLLELPCVYVVHSR